MSLNAVQLLARLRLELRERFPARWVDRDLVDFLNEGHIEVAKATFCLTKSVIIEVQTGIPVYPILKYLPDFHALNRADWQDRTLWELSDLDRWTLGSNAFESPNDSVVRKFGIEAGNFCIYPAPTVTRYTAATVTVVQDSVTVTVAAGTPAANSVIAGWIFGLGATPSKWYAIKAVDDVAHTITLQEPYREETNAVAGACVFSNGALRISYAALPPLVRLLSASAVYYNTGTATFTLGANSVVGTATAWKLFAQDGMEIGPGTATAPPREHQWLKVRGRIDDTHLRLWEAHAVETSAAPENYLLCDQSPFTPHEDRSIAAVYYAAKLAWQNVENGQGDSQLCERRYMSELSIVKAAVSQEMGRRNVPPHRVKLPYHAFFGGDFGGGYGNRAW